MLTLLLIALFNCVGTWTGVTFNIATSLWNKKRKKQRKNPRKRTISPPAEAPNQGAFKLQITTRKSFFNGDEFSQFANSKNPTEKVRRSKQQIAPERR